MYSKGVFSKYNCKDGFTLIELLVVISIIALLLSIMMPSLTKAREMARKIYCSANLKSIGLGVMLYAESNDGAIVPGDFGTTQVQEGFAFWDDRLRGKGDFGGAEHLYGENAFKCPSDKTPYEPVAGDEGNPKRSYAVNAYMHGNATWGPWPIGIKLTQIRRPGDIVSTTEAWNKRNVCASGNAATVWYPGQFSENLHDNFSKINELFFDFHVEVTDLALYDPMGLLTDALRRHYVGKKRKR